MIILVPDFFKINIDVDNDSNKVVWRDALLRYLQIDVASITNLKASRVAWHY